jgi:hypothetical protein
MDRRSVVLYLDRKGWMARVIRNDLIATLGEEVLAYIPVTKYLGEVQTGRDDATPLPEDISPHIDDSDEPNLGALGQLPFSSVQQLSHATLLPKTTVYRRFSEKLGVHRVISKGASCPL